MNKIHQWLTMNKLTLNVSKTSCLFFPASRNLHPSWEPHIYLGQCRLNFPPVVKYLGIYLDNKLKFKHHIFTLASKLRHWIGIFRKISHLMTINAKYTLYYAMFYPNVLYGIELYGSTSKALTDVIQVIQNKAIKALFGYPRLFNTQKLYHELHLSKITPLFKIRTTMLIWNLLNTCHNLHVHYTLTQVCTLMSHPYPTRDKLKFKLDFQKVSFTSSFSFKLLLLWNALPANLKSITSHTRMKDAILEYYSEGRCSGLPGWSTPCNYVKLLYINSPDC